MRKLLFVVMISSLLLACGNKGPLYLPLPKPEPPVIQQPKLETEASASAEAVQNSNQ